MSGADEYRRNAIECLQALKTTATPEVRSALLSMAQRWNEAADRWERGAAQLGPKGARSPPKSEIFRARNARATICGKFAN
jgi:hypothetical protein